VSGPLIGHVELQPPSLRVGQPGGGEMRELRRRHERSDVGNAASGTAAHLFEDDLAAIHLGPD
jgi:hypothetical protein